MENPVQRAVVLVVLNASIGLVFRALTTYAPIFDIISIVSYMNNEKRYFWRSGDDMFTLSIFCQDTPQCHFIEFVANFLNIFPLCILLVFYFNFDKNFNQSFKDILCTKKLTIKTPILQIIQK